MKGGDYKGTELPGQKVVEALGGEVVLIDLVPGHSTTSMVERARAKIDTRLARSVTATRFNGDDLGQGIGEAVAEVIPSMIGDIVSGALGAAFSGDASRLKRLENLDAQIEARVEQLERLQDEQFKTKNYIKMLRYNISLSNATKTVDFVLNMWLFVTKLDY